MRWVRRGAAGTGSGGVRRSAAAGALAGHGLAAARGLAGRGGLAVGGGRGEAQATIGPVAEAVGLALGARDAICVGEGDAEVVGVDVAESLGLAVGSGLAGGVVLRDTPILLRNTFTGLDALITLAAIRIRRRDTLDSSRVEVAVSDLLAIVRCQASSRSDS
jgi:hypothetical protein